MPSLPGAQGLGKNVYASIIPLMTTPKHSYRREKLLIQHAILQSLTSSALVGFLRFQLNKTVSLFFQLVEEMSLFSNPCPGVLVARSQSC